MSRAPGLFDGASRDAAPLAERMRPKTGAQVVGQAHVMAPDRPIGRMLASGTVRNLVVHGPPGSGKTTIAKILAAGSGLRMVEAHATTTGVAELRRIGEEAARQHEDTGRATLLFLDEIHLLNKTVQSALLKPTETGALILIAATTANVGFEIVPALLSRCQTVRLNALDDQALEAIVTGAERREGKRLPLEATARQALIGMSGGDARHLLAVVEELQAIKPERPLTTEDLAAFTQRRATSHDRAGDHHYALLSAFQKSIRGSDPDAALYYLARLLVGGEPPRAILRRLSVMATEEVGLSDPDAIVHTQACCDAFERVGEPEGLPAIGQCVLRLTTATRSNRAYKAFYAAMELADRTSHLPPPMHVVNAPTRQMKAEGFKAGYQYDHDAPDGFSGQEFMPDALRAGDGPPRLYEPSDRGEEAGIANRMAGREAVRRKKREESKG